MIDSGRSGGRDEGSGVSSLLGKSLWRSLFENDGMLALIYKVNAEASLRVSF